MTSSDGNVTLADVRSVIQIKDIQGETLFTTDPIIGATITLFGMDYNRGIFLWGKYSKTLDHRLFACRVTRKDHCRPCLFMDVHLGCHEGRYFHNQVNYSFKKCNSGYLFFYNPHPIPFLQKTLITSLTFLFLQKVNGPLQDGGFVHLARVTLTLQHSAQFFNKNIELVSPLLLWFITGRPAE